MREKFQSATTSRKLDDTMECQESRVIMGFQSALLGIQ